MQTVVLNDKLEKVNPVDPSEICSVDKALEVLCCDNQRKTYLVSRGDSLWSIAVKITFLSQTFAMLIRSWLNQTN